MAEIRQQRIREHVQRLVHFGREHPVLTTLGLAGAGLIGGLEMAAGALLGAGVATMIRRSGEETIAEPEQATAKPEAKTTAEPEGEAQERPGPTRYKLRDRARAVMYAVLDETAEAAEHMNNRLRRAHPHNGHPERDDQARR